MTDDTPIPPAGHALPSSTLDALRGIAAADVLLVAVDFDGTLSLLVKDSMSARMLPEARSRSPLLRDNAC